MGNHIVCFGEVLFDVFPTYRCIGGAPLNVSYRLQSFGNKVDLISRVGDDTFGLEIIEFLNRNGIGTQFIQIDDTHKTSEVKVKLSQEGNASYEIEEPCAWDFIKASQDTLQAVSQADAFVFGSLACRNPVSKSSLIEFLKRAKYKIFDVNLRAPFYEIEVINELMLASDFIKFNDDEILLICEALGFKTKDLVRAVLFISKQTSTSSICVTKGDEGALLFTNNTFFVHDGYKVEVVNTVGAGDSFLAAVTDQLLRQKQPNMALDFACHVGSEVVTQKGATTQISLR